MIPKKSIALIVYLLCCTHEIHGALSNSDQKRITICDPLVLLTGTSNYDTMKNLGSVKDEMRTLYTLFKITCGYDVKSTYFNDNGDIISDHNDVVKKNGEEEKISDDDQNSSKFEGRLSEGRLQDFIHDQYSYLYKHRKKYDALIFIFSGHGYGNDKGNDMLLCSNFYTQYNKPKNHVFLADIKATFTNSTNNNYVKDFSKKPKLFFDLACRGGSGGKSLNFKEDKSQYKGVKKTYKKANSVTYYTTTPGETTTAEIGVKFVQFLSKNIEKSLNKTAYENSLQGIMNKVSLDIQDHDGCPDSNGPLFARADNIFFAKKRKIVAPRKNITALVAKVANVQNADYAYKVSLIGDDYVGKSHIYARLKKGIYSDGVPGTYPWARLCYNVKPNNENVHLNIFDTAGLDPFSEFKRYQYRNVKCLILCYDLTQKRSYESCKKRWKKEIEYCVEEKRLLILCGTKSDLVDKRVITPEQVTKLENCFKQSDLVKDVLSIEVSAKDNRNIEKLMKYAAFYLVSYESKK